MSADVVASGTGSARAWLDVRKGRVWTGVKVPVELSLREGALLLTVSTIRLGKKERGALVRLCGDDVLGTLIAKREKPELVVPLDGTRFRYPSFPGLGRTSIVVEMDGRPPVALSFVDPDGTGNPLTTNPYKFTVSVFTAGPAARRVRDSWREAIEACR